MPARVITLFDSVDLGQIPAGATAVAAYVDGKFANAAEARDRFPRARILTIAVFADHDADCLDIEDGNARPDQAAAWYLRQKARGARRPCLYASASLMHAQVIPAIQAAGIARGTVRLWSAHYTRVPHICGPASCRELATGADGTQWTDRAFNRNLDQSLLLPSFFGDGPTWTETMIANLPALQQGAADHPGAVQYVHRIQALVAVIGDINHLPFASAVKADGTFGAATTAGVKAVQQFFGIAQDGIVGQATWTALVTGQR